MYDQSVLTITTVIFATRWLLAGSGRGQRVGDSVCFKGKIGVRLLFGLVGRVVFYGAGVGRKEIHPLTVPCGVRGLSGDGQTALQDVLNYRSSQKAGEEVELGYLEGLIARRLRPRGQFGVQRVYTGSSSLTALRMQRSKLLHKVGASWFRRGCLWQRGMPGCGHP
jgi:hypothetical protein